jgi:hypothetical protein
MAEMALTTVTVMMLLAGLTCSGITRLILRKSVVPASAAAGWGAVLGPIGIVVASSIAAGRSERLAAGAQSALIRARGVVDGRRSAKNRSADMDPFA